MATGQEIEDRMIDFAVTIMELYDTMPKTFPGRLVGQQLLRAGTAVAANYAEVRGAESKNDFIHKLGIVRKELYECLVWLRLLGRRGMVPAETVEPIRSECDQSCRIIYASKATAEANVGKAKMQE